MDMQPHRNWLLLVWRSQTHRLRSPQGTNPSAGKPRWYSNWKPIFWLHRLKRSLPAFVRLPIAMAGRLAQSSQSFMNWNCRSVNVLRQRSVKPRALHRRIIHPTSGQAKSKTVCRRNHDPDDAMASSGLLTAQQEVQLAGLIQAGGEAAKEAMTRFVQANQGLVYKVARRYQGYGLDLEDLVQEGNLGLMRAVDKFDPQRGYKFSTMAWWWIQQAITRAIQDTGRTIRLPVHLQEAMRRVNKAEVHLAASLDRQPTDKELAEATGFTVTRIQELRGIPWTVSLEEPLAEEDLSLESLIADPTASCEEPVIADMQAEQLDRLLAATLTPREYLV